MRLDAGPGYPSKSKTNRTSDTSPANHHAGPTGYRLVQPHPRPAPGPVATPLTTSEAPAPALSLNEAKERLDTTALPPFLFFADRSRRPRPPNGPLPDVPRPAEGLV